MFNRKLPYDNFFNYAQKSDFVTEREYFTWQKPSEDSDHFSVQCNLISGGGGDSTEVDPKTLSFRDRLKWRLRKFCADTTAHGIFMISDASALYNRVIWIILFVGCLIVLYQNARSIIAKYNRSEKIVNIALNFESAPFPSVTVCNLNPYKASEVNNVESIRRTLSAFDHVMQRSPKALKSKSEDNHDAEKPETEAGEMKRRRRATKDQYFEPGITNCVCGTTTTTTEPPLPPSPPRGAASRRRTRRQAQAAEAAANAAARSLTGGGAGSKMLECDGDSYKTEPLSNDKRRCICAYDRSTTDAWPCYPQDSWRTTTCSSCSENAFCVESAVDETSPTGFENLPCLCAPAGGFCVAYNDSLAFVEIWRHITGIDDPIFLKAMGFEGMTDEVAIVTKAKENIMFAMAALPMPVRQRLSHAKHELIHKCSFSGRACDIEKDFLIHIDPVFGSCFTFNHNRLMNLTSIKAGPMYGLRMIVYVNASDYMPTTEATGVRLTIHDKEDYPFPDTFGYSAPTGFVSSFGLKLRKMERLPAPYGDCLPHGKDENYIYQNYDYSVEGCFRSCFQQRVLRACGCGDPRFPLPANHTHCEVTDPAARRCLESNEAGGMKMTKTITENGTMLTYGDDSPLNVVDASLYEGSKCLCRQPCRQSSYSVTYSPARWPSESLQLQLGSCNSSSAECARHYHENGAMIEVFYEQLNFQMLTESEAYGFVNLLADVGGQLGLWCGISFLSICEIIYLCYDLALMTVQHYVSRMLKRHRRLCDGETQA